MGSERPDGIAVGTLVHYWTGEKYDLLGRLAGARAAHHYYNLIVRARIAVDRYRIGGTDFRQ